MLKFGWTKVRVRVIVEVCGGLWLGLLLKFGWTKVRVIVEACGGLGLGLLLNFVVD